MVALVERGPTGAGGGGALALPPAPTVIHAPVAVDVGDAATLLARSAYRFPVTGEPVLATVV